MPFGLQHGKQNNHQGEQVFFAHGERLGGEDALDSVVTISVSKTLQGVGTSIARLARVDSLASTRTCPGWGIKGSHPCNYMKRRE